LGPRTFVCLRGPYAFAGRALVAKLDSATQVWIQTGTSVQWSVMRIETAPKTIRVWPKRFGNSAGHRSQAETSTRVSSLGLKLRTMACCKRAPGQAIRTSDIGIMLFGTCIPNG
jgi:hypothetical protein